MTGNFWKVYVYICNLFHNGKRVNDKLSTLAVTSIGFQVKEEEFLSCRVFSVLIPADRYISVKYESEWFETCKELG